MSHFVCTKAKSRKITALALAAATLFAPQLSSGARAAMASDGRYDNGRYNDSRNSDDSRYDNSRYDDRNNDIRNNIGETQTFTGFITREPRDSQIEIRTDSGRNLTVQLRDDNFDGLRRGARVRVTGQLRDDNSLRRASVFVLSSRPGDFGYGNGGYGNYRRVTLRGRVTRELRNRRFEIRQNNTTYEIVVARDESRRFNKGDSVEVVGQLYKGNLLRADSVRFVNGGWNGGDWNDGDRVRIELNGRVLDTSGRRFLTVRGDNGLEYQVRANFNFDNRISRGDRVFVAGNAFRNTRTVYASRIELRRDNGDGNNGHGWNNGDRIDVRGTIRDIRRSFFNAGNLIVESESGRTWTIAVGNTRNWNVGDRVRVRGTVRDDSIRDARVDRW